MKRFIMFLLHGISILLTENVNGVPGISFIFRRPHSLFPSPISNSCITEGHLIRSIPRSVNGMALCGAAGFLKGSHYSKLQEGISI